ncbi:hypothetical protein D9M68_269050 [compost metagenome]|uniref:hypothetical protein n=1 Tax=Cupriavidus necator TaxID=106590 RepID=UPI0028B78769
MTTAKAGNHPPPDTRVLYPATALYARVDCVDLKASVAIGNWSPDAELAAWLDCPILALNPRAYHFFIVPPEATVHGLSLVRAVPK